MLPRDFDIFWLSSPRMTPWFTSRWNGSDFETITQIEEHLVPEPRVKQV